MGNNLGTAPDMHRLLTNFRESLTSRDYLMLGVEMVNEHLIRRVLKQYEVQEALNFVFGSLAYYGVKWRTGRWTSGSIRG